MAAKKEVVREVGRDSGNGQFVPIKETQRRPATTEKERIHYPAPAPKKKS
jgi:hypothetical protein